MGDVQIKRRRHRNKRVPARWRCRDVLYLLVEDPVFHNYMQALFGSAERFFGIYSESYERRSAGKQTRASFFAALSNTGGVTSRANDRKRGGFSR